MIDSEVIEGLASAMTVAGYPETASATLADGREVTVGLEPDPDTQLEENGDWFGLLEWEQRNPNTGRTQRPAAFNGAARKIAQRSGPGLWWQPPADLLNDPANLAKLERVVRGYYREEWCYVGVVVRVRELPCACCGSRRETVRSIWGVESNVDASYLAEVIGDLIEEAALTHTEVMA